MKSKDKPSHPGRKILAGLVCLVLAFTIIPRGKTIYQLSRQREELEQQKAVLLKMNKELTREAQKANSPETIEKIAREQLGLIKKGERALVEVKSDQ